MQLLKEEIRKNILEESTFEFLEYGFEGMAIRRVAEKIGISPSNIYNYFKNKDEIFCEVVRPTSDFVFSILDNAASKEMGAFDSPEYIDWHIAFINMLYRLVSFYKEPLKLLLVNSKGSSFQGFKESIVRKYTEMQICGLNRESGTEGVSDFFLYNFTLYYINNLEQMVINNFLPDEIKKYLVEMTIYSHGGFLALIGQKEEFYNKLMEQIKI